MRHLCCLKGPREGYIRDCSGSSIRAACEVQKEDDLRTGGDRKAYCITEAEGDASTRDESGSGGAHIDVMKGTPRPRPAVAGCTMKPVDDRCVGLDEKLEPARLQGRGCDSVDVQKELIST